LSPCKRGWPTCSPRRAPCTVLGYFVLIMAQCGVQGIHDTSRDVLPLDADPAGISDLGSAGAPSAAAPSAAAPSSAPSGPPLGPTPARMRLEGKIERPQAQYSKEIDTESDPIIIAATSSEARLKAEAKSSMAAMAALVNANGPTPKAMSQLHADAMKATRAIWVERQAIQRAADKKAQEARMAAVKAHYHVGEIETENLLVRAKWKNVSMDSELKDVFACAPFPSCLKTQQDNNQCGDSYPAVACIRARRGSMNLCITSAKVQKNCCSICLMENLELCKKERLILAGFGEDAAFPAATGNASSLPNASDPDVGVDKLHQWDTECAEFSQKDMADEDIKNPAPFSPAYNHLIQSAYETVTTHGDGNGAADLADDLAEVSLE